MLGINNPWVIGTKWEGFFAQKAGVPIRDNPHIDEMSSRLWSNGFSSALDGQQSVSGNFECYWFAQVHDSENSYQIYYGCGFLGQGRLVVDASTIDRACDFVPRGERIYRITRTDDPRLYKLNMAGRGRKRTVADPNN